MVHGEAATVFPNTPVSEVGVVHGIRVLTAGSRGFGCLVRLLFRWVDIVKGGTPLVIRHCEDAQRILESGNRDLEASTHDLHERLTFAQWPVIREEIV